MGIIKHFVDKATAPRFVPPRKYLNCFGRKSEDFTTYLRHGYYWYYDKNRTRYNYKKNLIKELERIIRDVMAYVQYFKHPYYGKGGESLSYFEVFNEQLRSLDFNMGDCGKAFGIDYFDNKKFARLRVALTLCILFRELHYINSKYVLYGYYYGDRNKPSKHHKIDMLLPNKSRFSSEMIYPKMRSSICYKIVKKANPVINNSYNVPIFNGLKSELILRDIDRYSHEIYGELLATIAGNTDTKLYEQLKEIDRYAKLTITGFDGADSFFFKGEKVFDNDGIYSMTDEVVISEFSQDYLSDRVIEEMEESEDIEEESLPVNDEASKSENAVDVIAKSEEKLVKETETKPVKKASGKIGKISLKWEESNNEILVKFEQYLIDLVDKKEIKDVVYFDETESVIYVRFKNFISFSEKIIKDKQDKVLMKFARYYQGKYVFHDDDGSSFSCFKIDAIFFKKFLNKWSKTYEECKSEITQFTAEIKEKV